MLPNNLLDNTRNKFRGYMFTPPNENLFWTVHRLRSTFVDGIGNVKNGIGTGFWVKLNSGKNIFVTNKHNVDPTIKFGSESDYKLNTVEIELRRWGNSNPTEETSFYTVENHDCIFKSKDADCALLISPTLHNHDDESFPISTITKYKDLAQESEFKNNIKLMETAIFIGYPGKAGEHWWDEVWKLPVARQCSLASWPAVSFNNKNIKSTNIILVSGLSFSGSSGSPVFVYNRGFAPGGVIVDNSWRPTRLIGIMSGHFQEQTETPAMFLHSGLSYLTRSTAIIEILNSVGEE